MSRLEDLTADAKMVAITCSQFGDSGKGKISEWLSAYWADVITRGQGGDNAGHTTWVNGVKRVAHLLPTGITQDTYGKATVLGNGMVINPRSALEEIEAVQADGIPCNNLMISQDAHAIMPYQVALDQAKDKSQKTGIGSTGKGIGPCYTDKIARRGITLGDLLDADSFSKGLDKALPWYGPHVKGILRIDNWPAWNKDDIIDQMRPYADRLRPFIRDTITEIRKLRMQGKKVLLEGAQGALIGVEHGTYPFVTSSDCSVNGMASGIGVSAEEIDLAFSIVKFPFITRVGLGPFPTEFGGRKSELYCADDTHRKEFELTKHGIPYTIDANGVQYDAQHPTIIQMLNDKDPFVQGIAVRLVADEYGATTGRARRTAWVDAVAGEYVTGLNGPRFIVTKPDCLSGINEFKVCVGYTLPDGSTTTNFQKNERYLRSVTPVYKTYEGYGDISDARSDAGLPKSLKQAFDDFERLTHGKIEIVSVGAERDATFVR